MYGWSLLQHLTSVFSATLQLNKYSQISLQHVQSGLSTYTIKELVQGVFPSPLIPFLPATLQTKMYSKTSVQHHFVLYLKGARHHVQSAFPAVPKTNLSCNNSKKHVQPLLPTNTVRQQLHSVFPAAHKTNPSCNTSKKHLQPLLPTNTLRQQLQSDFSAAPQRKQCSHSILQHYRHLCRTTRTELCGSLQLSY